MNNKTFFAISLPVIFLTAIYLSFPHRINTNDPHEYLAFFVKKAPRFPINIKGLSCTTATMAALMISYMPPHLRRTIKIWAGYRSVELQAQIVRAAYAETHPNLKGRALRNAVLRGYSHRTNGRAAPPGKSNHQSGMAIDIRGSKPAMKLLYQNAHWFWLQNPSSIRRNDPWHFELIKGAPVICLK
jgi:D-alanyl-D-alanine carboxypeptidase